MEGFLLKLGKMPVFSAVSYWYSSCSDVLTPVTLRMELEQGFCEEKGIV